MSSHTHYHNHIVQHNGIINRISNATEIKKDPDGNFFSGYVPALINGRINLEEYNQVIYTINNQLKKMYNDNWYSLFKNITLSGILSGISFFTLKGDTLFMSVTLINTGFFTKIIFDATYIYSTFESCIHEMNRKLSEYGLELIYDKKLYIRKH